jgi:hypothetical protein
LASVVVPSIEFLITRFAPLTGFLSAFFTDPEILTADEESCWAKL